VVQGPGILVFGTANRLAAPAAPPLTVAALVAGIMLGPQLPRARIGVETPVAPVAKGQGNLRFVVPMARSR